MQVKKKLTPKQKAMIAERLKDPKAPNATIIERAGYNLTGVGNARTNTASQIYLENMRNPEISKQLDNVVDEIEQAIITTVRDYATDDRLGYRTLAMDNAKWIHDKVKGKATQRTEVQTTGVTLAIDLTGMGMDPSVTDN